MKIHSTPQGTFPAVGEQSCVGMCTLLPRVMASLGTWVILLLDSQVNVSHQAVALPGLW